ncbi:hypothetical protein LCGC14_2547700 [marine sediment metagenome]|uniref:PD-(D/E)XK endonuclease-like domain-containing protein n=1 Tax=marine sediment metagenome TaxID=412755 RepID=A0A0F9APE1_9ZZZZ
MVMRKKEYQEAEKFDEDFDRGIRMLNYWWDKWYSFDLENYEILEVEVQHSLKLGPNNDFTFTLRPDRIMRNKRTQNVEIFEVKTTGWSIGKVFEKVERGSQATAYVWGLNKVHPEWNIRTVIPEILYNRGKVIDAKRPGIAYRSEGRLTIFEMGLYSTILEVTKRYKSLETYPWPLLFPPHENHCTLFGCEYTDVCEGNLKPGSVPPGFERDEWADLEEHLEKTKDFELKDYIK